jgi:hypothetical protein
MLSEARKFKVFLWGAHQNWSQLPERMRDAFSNVGVEVTFGLDRVGSEFSAKKVGSVDLSQTKQADADEHELTAFKSVPDQWEEWIETIKDLPVSEAIVSVRKRRRRHWYTPWVKPFRRERPKTAHVQLAGITRPQVYGEFLREVEQYYLHRYFTAEADVVSHLAQTRTLRQPAKRSRREVLSEDP